jgi:hypothetical protein
MTKKEAMRVKRVAAAKKAWVTIHANRAAVGVPGGKEGGVVTATKASPASKPAKPLPSQDAAAREERLRSPVVSSENIGGGVNNAQKVVLENGEVAIFKPDVGEPTPPAGQGPLSEVTDLEKARQLFRDAGLAFPSIPMELAEQMEERGRWVFSTRPVDMSPYNLQHYVEEGERSQVEDYAVLSHSGHGVNSYAIQYYLVKGSLHTFLHLGWGGVYADTKKDAAQIRDCFSIADRIVTAAENVVFQAGERLVVVGSDFYGSYWSPPGKNKVCNDLSEVKPFEVLAEALDWLTNHGGGKLETPATRRYGNARANENRSGLQSRLKSK